MKLKYLIPSAILLITLGIWFSKDSETSIQRPQPTSGETIVKEGGEDGDNQMKREAWFELMHSSAPGTNWKSLEYQTSMKRHIKRSEARSIAATRGDNEILANGNLKGKWYERGSLNQSGSVFVTEYDQETDMIYLISAGGSLFKSPSSGEAWEVINQDLRFENNFLKLIDTGAGKRLLANILDLPHYSDDFGNTWTPASGISSSNPNGRSMFPIVLEDGSNHIYMLSKASYWDDYRIYKSTDNGETYESIINLSSNFERDYKMVKPHHSNDIYFIEKDETNGSLLYKLNQNDNTLELLSQNPELTFAGTRTNMVATQMDSITRFVAYNTDRNIVYSEDFGTTWTQKGQMPTNPWSVGIYMTPSNPDHLIYGEVECYHSLNGGETWFKINDWGAYYGDIERNLHADMMYFNEFEKSDGSPFLLVSNHGGLSVTYDEFISQQNIGLEGLNVSQYYDVVTDPTNPDVIYAGSQDQGFQRATVDVNDTGVANFEQVISGDYGHIVFSENGQKMWTVYPGGWVTYYNNPQFTSVSASWEVKSDNETVWIPPLMSSPDPAENAIYLAGGSIDRADGSYLIKLAYNPTTNSIDTSQIDYDFYDYSVEGTISMMRTSPVNPDHWYVSTTNGRFFYSYDGGTTWDQTVQFVPGGHYLYGATIYPSKFDENTVYFGGSGYSGPAVFKSTDGGQNFQAMNNGMPETLVFEITANSDESLFFAATEAGPYVYVVAEEQWYDMSGMAAPNQTYWSVEYLEELETVRFGTYGRGIWDFQVSLEVSTNQAILSNASLKVFPNPTSDVLNISLEQTKSKEISLEFSDINGKQVLSQTFETTQGQTFNHSLSLSSYPKGTYLVTLRDGDYISSRQVVLQ